MSNVLQRIEADQPVIGKKVTFRNPTTGGNMPKEMEGCQIIGEITSTYQLNTNPDPDDQTRHLEWFIRVRNISHNYAPFSNIYGLKAKWCAFED